MRIVSLVVGCLCATSSAYAYEHVQLPFAEGASYECLQNSGDIPSHMSYSNSTKLDLDFGMPVGTTVTAAHDGVVKKVSNTCRSVSRTYIDGNGVKHVVAEDAACGGGWGNFVVISHDNSSKESVYAHFSKDSFLVKEGQRVATGQPIGFSGSSGHSTGAHLHFGVHEPFNNSVGMTIYANDVNTGTTNWFSTGVPRSTSDFVCYNPYGHKAPGHAYKAIPANGDVFYASQCAELDAERAGKSGVHCWHGDKGADGTYHMGWCDEAGYHLRYYKDASGYHSEELSAQEGWALCSAHKQEKVNLVAFLSGRAYGGGFGGGDTTSSKVNLTQDTDILGPEGTERRAEHDDSLRVGETITIRTEICAHGGNTRDARVKNGKKIDTVFEVRLPGQGWQQFAKEETKDSNLKKGHCHTEKARYTVPNVVGSQIAFRATIDARDEIRESNEGDNQGRDEVFVIAAAPQPQPVQTASYSADGRFAWNSAGPINGMHCTQIHEAADPHTWSDNYFCADRDYGIRWNSAGPIDGMRCTQIYEAADPHTWWDNYLCVPHDSPLQFFWSSAGPIPGLRCTQWLEAADPHTWRDNYLCYH